MKRGRMAAALVAVGATLVLTGCGSGKSSSTELASNEAMTVSATQTPARQRGLMFAGDNLGRAVFADEAPALASVPDRDR